MGVEEDSRRWPYREGFILPDLRREKSRDYGEGESPLLGFTSPSTLHVRAIIANKACFSKGKRPRQAGPLFAHPFHLFSLWHGLALFPFLNRTCVTVSATRHIGHIRGTYHGR